MTSPAPLILVDGSSYLFRAFHALPPLTNSKGQPTGAVHGVLNMLLKLREDYAPEHMAVVFDAKGPTFRNEMYDQYKANRPPIPEDLRAQIEPLHKAVEAYGFPLICVPGVEADDVIGTLARQAEAAGMSVVISTGDKDFAQLVSEKIILINTMNNTTQDIAGVQKKFGVPPEKIIDYLALIGDTVDNVPGVPKVGPKTAVKWLDQWGDLASIMANADQFKGKIGENLRNTLEQLPLSRDLVTIKCDVELDQGPTELTFNERDTDTLRQLFTDLEMNRQKRLLDEDSSAKGDDAETPSTPAETKYVCIQDLDVFETWLEKLRTAEIFAFDTETTSLDYMQADIVGVSFAVEAGEAAYVPVAHQSMDRQLGRDYVLGQLKPLLEDTETAKLGQNLKYDMSVLARHGIEMRGIAHDTMLESYCLDSTATRHDMDSLAEKYLDRSTIHYEDVAGKGKKQLTFDQVPLEQAVPYACEDADITLQLHQTLWPRLNEAERVTQLYQDVEVPLVSVLSRIERNGVRVDAAMLEAQTEELTTQMEQVRQQAFEVAGEEFNLGSPKQLQAILFEKMELPVLKKTPKGQPSTAEPVLEEMASQGHELPKLIMEYRGLSKLISTYTDKLPKMVNPDTGRVHTSYHQAVAATGRLSSTDPNLQNIPVRNEAGRRIRQAFIPAEEHRMLAADYSQIELRIMAHLSGDDGLLRAFSEGADIHRATAAEIFGVTSMEVSTEQRRSAKAVNFGLIYGMSAFGLAQQLGVARNVAQEYIDLYFSRYPGVREFMDNTREQAKKRGYVETVFGRRLYLPEINARNPQRRQYAERTAINAPMQGTAADIIKKAMIAVDAWLRDSDIQARILMQVHDELVFEVAENDLSAARDQIRKLMTQAAELSVPLIVDIGVGDNWDQAH